jgi:hypothetical protein
VDNEVFFAKDRSSSAITRMVRRGEAVRLATGVYTTSADRDPADVVAESWATIAANLFPGAVVTDRSGPTGTPVDGFLWLSRPERTKEVALPGLTIVARTGPGPLEGDLPLRPDLYVASRGRALADNMAPSRRRRADRPKRTLDREEIATWIDQLAADNTAQRLVEFREQAEALGAQLGVDDRDLATLSELIGVAIGTRQAEGEIGSPALDARRQGRPYDQRRIERLDLLVKALRGSAPQHHRRDPERQRFVAFFEAYFSNFIEGTEFTLEDAHDIVFEGLVIAERLADSHDLEGTYALVSDDQEMSRLAARPSEFVDLLRERHRTIMGGRPEAAPGELKSVANKAGNTVFVAPGLVRGTLIEGFARLADLDTAWERSVFTMFLVSEVHPFNDGNGRLARAMMNAELVADDQCRTIIPIVFRGDYLDGLRLMSRDDNPSLLIKSLRYAHDYTASIDFTDFDSAVAELSETNAFEEPESLRRLTVRPPTSMSGS